MAEPITFSWMDEARKEPGYLSFWYDGRNRHVYTAPQEYHHADIANEFDLGATDDGFEGVEYEHPEGLLAGSFHPTGTPSLSWYTTDGERHPHQGELVDAFHHELGTKPQSPLFNFSANEPKVVKSPNYDEFHEYTPVLWHAPTNTLYAGDGYAMSNHKGLAAEMELPGDPYGYSAAKDCEHGVVRPQSGDIHWYGRGPDDATKESFHQQLGLSQGFKFASACDLCDDGLIREDGFPRECICQDGFVTSTWKFGHRLEWQPGTYGKGFVLDDGQVWTWPVDEQTRKPWHMEKSYELKQQADGPGVLVRGPADHSFKGLGYTGAFEIKPDGEIHRTNKPLPSDILQPALDADPNLRNGPEDPWRLSRVIPEERWAWRG